VVNGCMSCAVLAVDGSGSVVRTAKRSPTQYRQVGIPSTAAEQWLQSLPSSLSMSPEAQSGSHRKS